MSYHTTCIRCGSGFGTRSREDADAPAWTHPVGRICPECWDRPPHERLDLHTGRPAKWECICLWSAHPHCPQHGDPAYRRDDIPHDMRVS